MDANPTPVVGREPEQQFLHEWFRDVAAGRARTVVLRGDPGVGKSTLLDDTVARADGAAVVRIAGAESEMHVANSALASLVLPLRDHAGALEESHTRALDGALRDDGSATNPLAVGIAVLELLARAAEAVPMLVLVDDAHWIDDASATALVFALRRCSAERVGALVAVRAGESSGFDAAGFEELPVRGLDAASGIALLQTTGPVDDRVAKQCWADVDGNPLALLELGAQLDDDQRQGVAPLDASLHLGERLEHAFVRRIDRLPNATRTALVVAAVANRGDMAPIVRALADLDLTPAAFAPAEAAGVVAVAGGTIEFRHPLLRAAIEGRAEPATRRAAHRALASALTDATDLDRRAWHLAGAAAATDAEAADALADVAERAFRRGGAVSAARAWEQSARLTPEPEAAVARLLRSGIAYWDGSMVPHALEVLDEVIERTDDRLVRADAASAWGEARAWEQDVAAGTRLLVDEAFAIEPHDPERACVMFMRAAVLAQMHSDIAYAVELAQHACRTAGGRGAIEIGARCIRGMALQNHGEGARASDDLAVLDVVASMPIADAAVDQLAVLQLVGYVQLVRERWEAARTTLDGVIAAARRSGLPGAMGIAGALRAEVAFRTGHWNEAEATAAADIELNGIRRTPVTYFGHATLARVEAARGRAAACREHAEPAAASGARIGMSMLEAWAFAALGLLELSEGAHQRAVDYLRPVWDAFSRAEARDPGGLWWQGDLLEALVTTGARADAERLVRELDDQVQTTGRVWGDAIAARGHGLLALTATRRDEELARSAALLDEVGAPFERARSFLLLGEGRVQRGDERAATALLEDALDAFQRLGAAPWVARTEAALGADRDAPVASVAEQLTSAELRVALAVAKGCTNREAGEELFLSTRTVDAHLRAIYRKLDIRTRTELALMLASMDPPESSATSPS